MALVNDFSLLSNVDGYAIDSRSVLKGDNVAFFALRTSRDDGHRYVKDLFSRGVRAFVVEQKWYDSHSDDVAAMQAAGAVIIPSVSPTEKLQLFAGLYRAQFDIKMIAVTGSRGKTIVKEWLNKILSYAGMSVVRSPRSYNSSLGVPLSLRHIDKHTELAIIEAGVSESGEMDILEQMIKPDMVVLTCIDNEHDEGFISRSEKIREKLKLASHARILVYSADDEDVSEEIARAKADGILPKGIRLVDYAEAAHRLNVAVPESLSDGWLMDDINAVVATAHLLGLNSTQIAEGVKLLRPMRTRLNVREGVNHSLLVSDDYPCDLHSLRPAIDFIRRRMTAGMRLILVIGDVGHENRTPAETYRMVAGLACRLEALVIGVGEEIYRYREFFGASSRIFRTIYEAEAVITPSDFADAAVVVQSGGGVDLSPILEKLEAKTHETVLEVNLDALAANYNFFKSRLRSETGIIAMVKASGYGAGSYELAKTLQNRGASYLAVAVTDEGVELRDAGIKMPIMVLNPKVTNYPLLFSRHLEPEIFNFDILEEIVSEARKMGIRNYPIHIKLDTGMHRLGFVEDEIDELIERLKAQDAVLPTSVFSHLATADCFDMDEYTLRQLRSYEYLSGLLKKHFPEIKRHVLNTAGILRFPEYQFDMVRLGIGLYGVKVLNDGSEISLRTVSTLHTPIIAIREWKAGEAIGYGRRGLLKRDSRIATIPIGYADGIDRRMGCGAVQFIVNSVPCPTVGSICMDVCMIDVTDCPTAEVGDLVEIFGPAHIANTLSEPLNTIPYEILTSVSPRVKRIYYSE